LEIIGYVFANGELESLGITFICNFIDLNLKLVYAIVMEMIMFKTSQHPARFSRPLGCPRKKWCFFILNKELLYVQGIKNP
jgi:hypothetical protein